MKSILIIIVFSLITRLAQSSTQLEISYQDKFEELNQEIKQELIYGDLSNHSVKNSLRTKINRLAPLAQKIGGRKHRRLVITSFEKTLQALSDMNKSYLKALDFTYANGLTGREIIIEALDPENNRRIVAVYNQNKDSLKNYFSGKKLRIKAMDLTIAELDHDQSFAFLKMDRPENFVMNDSAFSFLKEKCIPAFGEEDFHLLIFGFNRCNSEKYRIDRWTVGPGFYNATSGYSYVTGLKIGNKGFKGIGVRVQAGFKKGYGIGVFIGNGLLLTLDLEQAYGLYGGATYFNLKLKKP